MKKIAIIILCISVSVILNAQMCNWASPPYQITFPGYGSPTWGSGLTPTPLVGQFTAANGAFDANNNPIFYIVAPGLARNYELFDASNTAITLPTFPDFEQPESEIAVVPVPGTCGQWYVIFVYEDGDLTDQKLVYFTVTQSGSTVTASTSATVIDVIDRDIAGIAVSRIDNGMTGASATRTLYCVGGSSVTSYTISASGITAVHGSSSPLFTFSGLIFNIYQVVLNYSGSISDKLMWCTDRKVFELTGLTTTPTLTSYSLPGTGPEGLINGVEYDALDNMYVAVDASYTGPPACLYQLTQAGVFTPITVSGSEVFGNSQLDMGRDGYIYAVSTAGNLGAINTTTLTVAPVSSLSGVALQSNAGMVPAAGQTGYTLPDQVTGENDGPLGPTSITISPSSTIICPGGSVTITATPTAGIGPYTFTWSDGTVTTGSTSTVTETAGGSYWVTVTDNNVGCSSAVSNTVTLANMPANLAGPNLSIDAGCASPCVTLGDPALTVLGFNIVGWFVGFTEVSTSAFYTVCPTTTTTYTLRLSPPVCGVAFASATVTVTNHTLTLGSVPLIPCGSADNCVPINIKLGGYTAGETVTVNWGGGFIPTFYTTTGAGDVVTSPCLTAGTYNITVTDENGCQVSITVTICYQECCHIDITQFTKIDATDAAVIAQLSSGASINWSGNIFVTGGELDVINNTTLNITNANVVFGDINSFIYTHKGGYLYAQQSIFQPCDLHSTWPGLKFDWYYNGGQIDNCTIINGVYGLWLGNGNSDINVTNNTFLNNEVGIILGINNYYGSITGNTFKLDVDHPYSCSGALSDFYGIQLVNYSTLYNGISQNNFVDALQDNNYPMHGIYSDNCSFMASQNNFTDLFRAFDVSGDGGSAFGPGYGVTISNNNIEYNFEQEIPSKLAMAAGFQYHMVRVTDCTAPLIESNTITGLNSGGEPLSLSPAGLEFTGIYVENSPQAIILDNTVNGFITCLQLENFSGSVLNNQLSGFETPVFADGQSGDIDISGNQIKLLDSSVYNYPLTYGIGTVDIAQEFYSSVNISGNYIDMTSDNVANGTATGLAYVIYKYNSYNAYVTSNCVFNTDVAMNFCPLLYFGGSDELTLPVIENNYLYNYEAVGMNLVDFTGNIGTPPTDFGYNSFVSNYHVAGSAAYDIAATGSTVGLYGNSTIFATYSPDGSPITISPAPVSSYNSSASCGNQVGAHNSTDITNGEPLFGLKYVLSGAPGSLSTSASALAWFSTLPPADAADNFITAMKMLARNSNSSQLDKFYSSAAGAMSADYRALVDFNYYMIKADTAKCASVLATFNPANQTLADYKVIAAIILKLAIKKQATSFLTSADITALTAIDNRRGKYASVARDLINAYELKHDYLFKSDTLPSLPIVRANGKTTYYDQNLFTVYPNPSSNNVSFDYVLTGEISNPHIKISDIIGNVIHDIEFTSVNGHISTNVTAYASGIYMATLYNGDSKISTVKFVKE